MHGTTYIGYENYAETKNKYIVYKILRVQWFREFNNFKMVTQILKHHDFLTSMFLRICTYSLGQDNLCCRCSNMPAIILQSPLKMNLYL